MIPITIDGQKAEVERGTTVLEAARTIGIEIPTLCYHESVPPYGVCRLCTVEVVAGKRSRLTTACTYPVLREITVHTASARVVRARRMILELLLARCPKVKKLQDLAREMGIEKSRFPAEDEDCILCGLCVRVCEELVGACAISFTNRGVDREVTTPFRIAPETCIACGACAFVCPTGAVTVEDIEGVRRIARWKVECPIETCSECGEYFAPEPQLEHIRDRSLLSPDVFGLCPRCRRRRVGNSLRLAGYKSVR
jgi:bidirectional [NiFe] hydrogenase diaphorase subunit